MASIAFAAFDHRQDGGFSPAHYRFTGDERRGWTIERDGEVALRLGPGFRLLRVRQCGVCATDLARRFLPFPLPQVIGHEVLAVDADGARFVVEINASHRARGLADDCAFCAAGLATHCPARVTLGIHDLPGGFGPWILAPVAACVPVPASVPDAAAVLVEPFAAALHAVAMIAPRAGHRVAVLGPRRLGTLVLAAAAAWRAQRGVSFSITALVRDPALAPLARVFGADAAEAPATALARGARFDVVVDTTGSPSGLLDAIALAEREVHLKSTHGQPAAGLAHLTELVVDELALAPLPTDAASLAAALPWCGARKPRLAWLAHEAPPSWLAASAELRSADAVLTPPAGRDNDLPWADAAVATTPAEVDAAIRPVAGRERAAIRPRAPVFVLPSAARSPSPLLAAIADRGLTLRSSRCGDFAAALALLAADPATCARVTQLITHRVPAARLPEAFALAGTRGCIKAVVEHDPQGERPAP